MWVIARRLVRSELGFLDCDDSCMCVVNKQFELLEFVVNSVYVDLKYIEIYLTFTAGYMWRSFLFFSVRLSWYPMWLRLLWCVYCCFCCM